MMRLRSLAALLVIAASPALGQGIAIDEGTFIVMRGTEAMGTETFRILHVGGEGSDQVRLTARGLEPIEIGGRSVTATKYSLGSGRQIWVDSAGRVLRVAQADGIVATREELPR